MNGTSRSTPAERRDSVGGSTAGGCPVGSLFAMLGQPHMLEVLHAFLAESSGPIRFNELQRDLQLSPRTLSGRLSSLVEAGLLVRRRFSELPPRVEYEATDKARELVRIFREMESWARHNSLTAVATVSVVGRA
jgi:DNA-binding HxlR family transcriptional regulator